MVENIYSNYTYVNQDDMGLSMNLGEGLGLNIEDTEPQDLRVIKRITVEEESGEDESRYVHQKVNNAEYKDQYLSLQLNKVNQVQNVHFQTSLKNLLSEPLSKDPQIRKQRSKRGVISKVPSWSQVQLQEAITSVITQKLRFTQASSRYDIPKGTLYDNILGKSKRMKILEKVGLTVTQELSVLEFCCEVSSMPYNRRTSCSLKDVTLFITSLKRKEGDEEFQLSKREAFRWWWSFTKKHNIISLYYQHENDHPGELTRSPAQEYIFHLLNCKNSIPISIPTLTQQSFPLTKLPTY